MEDNYNIVMLTVVTVGDQWPTPDLGSPRYPFPCHSFIWSCLSFCKICSLLIKHLQSQCKNRWRDACWFCPGGRHVSRGWVGGSSPAVSCWFGEGWKSGLRIHFRPGSYSSHHLLGSLWTQPWIRRSPDQHMCQDVFCWTIAKEMFQWKRISNSGVTGSIPGLGKSPGEENDNSSILAEEIPWTEEPGELESMGSKKNWTWVRN